ncbi:MAG: HAMP domain-containing protein [Candidatus Goldbacteria bacterium]|nr:HAMP domain-containing protein [Candidatus Goldiibacteriota bacterium]
MKRRTSITTTVFIIACITLIFSSAIFILLTNTALARMINNSRTEVVNYRFDGIIGILERKNDRLKLSHNIPIYIKAFQDSALLDIHKTYCINMENGASFTIIQRDGVSLSHPAHKEILRAFIPDSIKNRIIAKGSGQFNEKINGVSYWFVFRHYPAWDWYIIYTVPLKDKYSEIRPFYLGFVASGGASFFAGLLLLTLFVYRSLLPVTKLTKATEAIAAGDLNYAIEIQGNNEIAVLAENFEKMRVSIKDKITELEKTMIELKRSNEDLEQYAYVSSHDLKEPLRILRLYSELIEKKFGPSLNAEGKEMLGFISTAASRMTTQIHDILEYAKAGRFDSGIESIDINSLISRLTDLYQQMHPNALITYKTEFDKSFRIEGDSTGLEQVLSNLIENALKYNRSPRAQINITAAIKDGSVEFAVADNGIGINKVYFDKIFEIFESLHPRDKFPGTGIGLALCKKVVERHGGKIWVESDGEGSGGSVFKFTLPVKQHHAAD